MVSPGELQVFLARVRRHAGRVDQLAAAPVRDPRDALVTALTELEMMCEDLLVANEELRAQGEELAAARAELAASQLRYQESVRAAVQHSADLVSGEVQLRWVLTPQP